MCRFPILGWPVGEGEHETEGGQENSTLTVRCAKSKQRPWRKVCLSAPVLFEMLAWREEDAVLGCEWVIHSEGHRIKRTIRDLWEIAQRKNGITRHLKAYGLRHTFATEALSAGADLNAVSSNMSHQGPTQLMLVRQSVLDRQRRAVAESIPDVLGIQNRDANDRNAATFQ